MAVMTNKQLAEKCIDIAKNYKTLYVLGCIGAPLNGSAVTRYTNNYPYNKEREYIIKSVANTNTFGFDCVCLIKSILWGWNGNANAVYGGAKYASNGVPDIGADTMIKRCTELSTDFSNIEIGEAVWLPGHIGVYVGDGLVVECTPAWSGDVQFTACNRNKSGYNRRNWTKHGKLPYVQYVKETAVTKPTTAATPSAAKDSYTGTLPTLPKRGYFQQGDTGTQVKNLQKFLNWSVSANLDVDGDFGPKTLAAVKSFQKKNGLVVDGLFGTKSLEKANSMKATATAKTVKKGCKVKVKKNAKTYNGGSVASFVYNNVYTVDELSGDRAVLDVKGICTAFKVSDLTVQ